MPLTSGETFAGYRIVRLLGSGGMGEVYLAEHPRLPRRDALKVLPADVSADPDYRARFNREADLASKLWHPHIVSVHDRGEYNGQLWIAMDYVDGLDAARLLAERFPNGMPADQVLRIVTAVASALDYAHKQGLLHRDVKPANIMLTHLDDDEQRIMLTDFGIARNADDISGLTATNMTVGTVAYSAPEQLMGEELDGRTDQYALAATAYHLLTGSHLFPHSNPAVVISRHLNAAPPELADSRPELAALDPALQAALAKDPKARFARCSDFARSLAKQTSSVASVGAAPTAPGSATPTAAAVKQPPPAKPPTVARTRPAWLIFAAMAVLIVATAAVLTWHPWQRTDRSGTPNPTLPMPAPANPTSAPSALPGRPSSSPISAASTSVAVAALPAYPPTNSGCQGTVTAHHDIDHKTLGAVRIFLMLNTTPGTDSEGCIAAVTAAGAVLPAIPLDARETFGFANPASDSTGNTFITYNPGRDDGVLVLIPNAGGFEDIGWDNTGGGTQHFFGRHAYYYAQLVGPGPDGRYTIQQSHNDCMPSCAGGTTTTKDLHWTGSDYAS